MRVSEWVKWHVLALVLAVGSKSDDGLVADSPGGD